MSLVISIFLKYDQIQIKDMNINFFIYYNISFCIIYFILKIYNNSWRFSGISEYTALISLSVFTTILAYISNVFLKLFTFSLNQAIIFVSHETKNSQHILLGVLED